MMRGESLVALSRELNVPAHRPPDWRDRVPFAAEGALKERERETRDDEIARPRAKVEEITMANELLHGKIGKLEAGRPLVGQRLRSRSRSDQSLQWRVGVRPDRYRLQRYGSKSSTLVIP